jgi:hypothetical protein
MGACVKTIAWPISHMRLLSADLKRDLMQRKSAAYNGDGIALCNGLRFACVI